MRCKKKNPLFSSGGDPCYCRREVAKKPVMPRNSSGNVIQVNVGGHISLLSNVPMYLSTENMRRMRCSCFGHLFDIPTFHNHGELFNLLIHKLDGGSQRRMRLAFVIGKEVYEFGPEEFAAITGLKFGGPIKLPDKSDFHRDVFGEKLLITFDEFEEKFMKISEDSDGDSELCLKLAFLHIVYSLFFIKDITARTVDLRYMHLMDNLDVFMAYPWGAAAYEHLVLETHRAKLKVTEKRWRGAKLVLEAHGFISALQCWIYEIMPDLASEFAIKVCDDRIPRMLQWSTDGDNVCYDALNSHFVPSAAHVVPFVIRDDEKPKLHVLGLAEYIESVVPPPSSLGPKTRGKRKLLFNDLSDDTSVPPEVRRSSRLAKRTSPATSNASSNRGDEVQCKQDLVALVVDISKRFEKFESNSVNKELIDTLSRIECHMATMTTLLNKHSSCLGTVTKAIAQTPSPTVEVCDGYKTPVRSKNDVTKKFECLSDETFSSKSDKVPYGDKAKVGVKTLAPSRTKPDSSRTRVGGTPHAFVPRISRSSKLIRPQLPAPPNRYDPFDRDDLWKNIVKEFGSWYEEARRTKCDEIVRLPTRYTTHATYEWFEKIWSPSNWLCSEHVDALVNLLIYKQCMNPELFLQGWTCLDEFGWLTLADGQTDAVAELVMPYVQGDYPHHGGLPWHNARVVYAIANINNNHWVAVEISLEEQRLTVYNSIKSSIDWKNPPVSLLNAAKFVPWLCRHKGIWDKRNSSVPLRSVWDVVNHPNTPQQQNTSDCGIMAMKFIECLASGHSIEDVDWERCAVYRRSYCGQLFKYGFTLNDPSDDI